MNPLVEDIKDAIGALIQTVIGLVLMALGIGLLVWEKMNPPTHDAHLWAELGLALLGAAIIPSVGPVLIRSLKAIVSVFVSVLPSRPAPKDPPT